MKLFKFASYLRKPHLAISMGLKVILLLMKSFLLKVPQFDFFTVRLNYQKIDNSFVFWWIDKKLVAKLKSFSRGIILYFCATKSTQPFKSYDLSKMKKGEKNSSRNNARSHHSKIPPETYTNCWTGSNWVRGSLHPLLIDLQSADIRDWVIKWHDLLGGKISIS